MSDITETEKLEAMIKYQQVRIGILEDLVNSIICFHQMKADAYNSCLPSDSNFWNQQVKHIVDEGVTTLDNLQKEIEEMI